MAMQAAFLAVFPHKRGRTLEGRRYVADYEDAGLGWTNVLFLGPLWKFLV